MNRYEEHLAPFACRSALSRGRRHPEPEQEGRNIFQRDRDRIIHSTAFRRLEYKTQVFVNHEGDHYRTRLTHSIEVAQIARSICRALDLQEDLAESVALAHDLGHTPFGHSGQDALNEVMAPYGGFEHNRQSLRIVTELERRYAAFPGLNLSYETLEGMIKHSSHYDRAPDGAARDFHPEEQPTLEAQIGNLADEIAYNNHDVDDGLRAGILTIEGLRRTTLFRRSHDAALAVCVGGCSERVVVHETVRRMINHLITDVIRQTRANLKQAGVTSLEDVRRAPEPLVAFSPEVTAWGRELKEYLHHNMYHHYRVARMSHKATRVIQELFHAYFEHPMMLPPGPAARIPPDADDRLRARVIADYIAGMTDRYALDEHDRLFATHCPT
ncbi:MAG: deoxyguanosinetriphosphate triphosphohydrolase [Zetaproteobacteria bacterium]|nr:MAG: deoxyguanosinetriphosphate triphosphohydrolase [Zetaproteobacteria bacterium]